MADYQSVAPTTTPVSLTEAKAQLNVSHDADDDLIMSYIQAATRYLEDRSQRCIINQTRVLKMNTFADKRYVIDRVIRPLRSPISSISSISYVASDGTTTTLASSNYTVSTGEKPGEIAESYQAVWPDTQVSPNDVTITYVAGMTSATTGVPNHVKQAVRFIVAHWYRFREPIVASGAVPKEIGYSVDALMGAEHVESYA